MKKSMLSFLLVLTLVAGMFSAVSLPVSAAKSVTEAQVTAKLAQAESVWPDGEAYIDNLDDGCSLCYGFIRELFLYLFDAQLPTRWTVETATFENSTQNVTQVGHLYSGYSLSELKALLAKALPGDVLIATNGGTNHGVIVRSVDEGGAGVRVYDANWGKTESGEPVIRANAYWSAETMHRQKPAAVTIYRYANYAGQPGRTAGGAEIHLEKVNCYSGQFADVSIEAWYAGSIGEAYELGLMNGSGEYTFDPVGQVSVAQAVTIASRIHSLYTTGETVTDTSSGGQWYQAYLDYAYQNGIIDEKCYKSDVTKIATRAQFAEILAKALPGEALYEINSVSDNAIPDVKMSSAYAESIYMLYRAGILGGADGNGTFFPQGNISRAEAACVISRMANSDNRISVTL